MRELPITALQKQQGVQFSHDPRCQAAESNVFETEKGAFRLKEWLLFRTLIILTGNLNIHRLYFLCYRTTGITSTFALPITPNWNPIKILWCEKSPSLCHLWATDPWEQEKKGLFQACYCMSYWRWFTGKNKFILLYCKSPVKPKLNLNK